MEYIPGKDGMLQSRAVSMDRIDSRKRRDAAEQSSSWKRQDDAEQKQFLDSLDFWKRRNAAEQSSSWIV